MNSKPDPADRQPANRRPSAGARNPGAGVDSAPATATGSRSVRSVGVFTGTYLPFSETFIHDQLRTHQRCRPVVLASGRAAGSAQRFPFERVHALTGVTRIAYLALGIAPAFDRIIRRDRIELLHAHFGTNGVYATPFAHRHRLPLVVTFHGHDVPALLGRNRFTRRYARYAALAGSMLRQADLLLPVSKDLADKLITRVGAPPHKVEHLRLGVDLDRFRNSGVPVPEPTVLMVGRFVEKKGHLFGLRAFAAARRQVPDAKLVIIGDGPLLDDYRREIRALGVGNAVTLTGAVAASEVVAWLNKVHVMLCPSVTAANGDVEGGVTVLKEAGAMRLPSIATIHGGNGEIVVDGETGYLVPERDVQQTAEHLVRLFRDDTLRNQMGTAARHFIETYYDLRKQVARLEDLYDGIFVRA